MTGISGIVVLLTSIPIAKAFSRMANIPQKYLPAMMMSSGASAAMAAPGAPTIGNITAASILGTTSTAGLLPGILSFLFVFLTGNLYLYRCIVREPEPEINESCVQADEEKKYPHVLAALTPLLIIFVSYAVGGVNITISLTIGILLALVLMRNQLCNRRKRECIQVLNTGFKSGTHVFFLIASLMGFASVIQETEGFHMIVESILSFNINPYFLAFVSVVGFTLLTSSPPAAIQLGVPALLPLVDGGFVTAEALHRISVIATTTFESMPYCGAAIIAMQMSGVRYKEGYPPIFICTVLIPLISTLLVTLYYIAI